jgi:23S rRNA (adenine2503-C2)-methyltransferase
MHHLLDPTSTALDDWLAERGEPRYRGGQIRQWVFQKRAESFDDMSSLPKAMRGALAESFEMWTTTVARHQQDPDGTEKLLFTLADGNQIESVLLRDGIRRTICISTQVGCAMGCVFCASGMLGLTRNLSAGEITEQIVRLDQLLPDDERITNIVVMGIGEPLANLDHLLQALDHVTADGGMGIGARRITISTVGLPAKIRRLAECGKAYNLAVSLHAPNEELRSQIIPVNEGIGLAEVLRAADDYFEKVGRRVSYEYILLGNLNDGPEHAQQLANLLKSRIAHVNLIPMNPVEESPFRRPSERRIQGFVEILEQAGVPVTVRKRKGADIDAACGQLRLRQHSDNALVDLKS